MKILSRVLLLWLLFVPVLGADEANVGVLKEFIGSLAKLDAAYLAAHGKKTPLKDFETALGAGREQLTAATSKPGAAPDLARELQAWAAVLGQAAQFLSQDTVGEEQRLWRAADELASLTHLARTLGGLVGPGTRLTPAERQTLGAEVESLFGKKMREFPRGDVSPFASGSRSPFASAMWMVNLAFDDSLKR